MDCSDFLKTTGAGGEQLARQAWAKAIEIAKAAAPASAAAIDAAFAPLPPPEPVEKSAGDAGAAAEKGA